MNHSQFLAQLVSLKFVPIYTTSSYDHSNKAYCFFTFAGEGKEGIILQCESLEFGPNDYRTRRESDALLTRAEAFFSVLMSPEDLKAIRLSLEHHPRVSIQQETPVEDKIAVNVKVNMGIGTPDDLFKDIDNFRRIGTLQQKWSRNPPMLFAPSYVVDNTIDVYKDDPEGIQRYLVQHSQTYIDHAKAQSIYPFAKIVHPGIGTHALY